MIRSGLSNEEEMFFLKFLFIALVVITTISVFLQSQISNTQQEENISYEYEIPKKIVKKGVVENWGEDWIKISGQKYQWKRNDVMRGDNVIIGYFDYENYQDEIQQLVIVQ